MKVGDIFKFRPGFARNQKRYCRGNGVATDRAVRKFFSQSHTIANIRGSASDPIYAVLETQCPSEVMHAAGLSGELYGVYVRDIYFPNSGKCECAWGPCVKARTHGA